MFKLIKADPVGCFHGIVKYGHADPKITTEFGKKMDAKRFVYDNTQQKRPRIVPVRRIPDQSVNSGSKSVKRRCSFCGILGHTISRCLALLYNKCSNCKQAGHRASHCILNWAAEEMCRFTLQVPEGWFSYFLNRAFYKAVATQDAKWLEMVLDNSFTMRTENVKAVLKIRKPAWRNYVLTLLLDWMEEDGKQELMNLLWAHVSDCLRLQAAFAKRRHDSKKRFEGLHWWVKKARDIRYLLVFCMLAGAPPGDKMNNSFFNCNRICRKRLREFLAINVPDFLLPELRLVLCSYVF